MEPEGSLPHSQASATFTFRNKHTWKIVRHVGYLQGIQLFIPEVSARRRWVIDAHHDRVFLREELRYPLEEEGLAVGPFWTGLGK